MEAHLERLLDNEINLTQVQISQGSTSHTYIRDVLKNKSRTDPNFPWIMDSFLTGSYARKTKLYPLDDIDVMVVIDGHSLFPTDAGSHVTTHYVAGDTQGINNPIHNHIRNNNVSSEIIMELFQNALLETFPDATVIRHDGQAVNVRLVSYGLGIDVVPCFHIKAHSTAHRDMYYIPQGKGNAYWLKTNPKIDEQISKNLHTRHNDKLRGIIKLLKYWNREKNANRISSYHLETLIWNVFHNHPSAVTSLTSGIQYFFNNARPYLEVPCPDATGIGDYVDKYMTPQDRQLSLAAFDAARRSLGALSGLLPPPLNKWKGVFGDKLGN